MASFSRGARLLAVLAVAALVAAPASADPAMKELGTDPANDAPPALDLTYLQVGRNDVLLADGKTLKALEIRLGVFGMLPVVGGYDSLPGIQWAFDVKGRTFVAEAYVSAGQPQFVLFELTGDTFQDLGELAGTYDWNDGYISMFVPLKTIKAKRGTVISGHGEENDADAHVHGAGTYYADYLTTTEDYIVP